MSQETVTRLKDSCRTTIRVSVSDKRVFNEMKPEGMSDWEFFRHLLAVKLTQLSEEEAAA